MVEKPNFDDAPSNLASIGRYVLMPEIFETLRGLSLDTNGEIQLADAINIEAKKKLVDVVQLKGKRFDCGSIDGFLTASNYEYKRRKIFEY